MLTLWGLPARFATMCATTLLTPPICFLICGRNTQKPTKKQKPRKRTWITMALTCYHIHNTPSGLLFPYILHAKCSRKYIDLRRKSTIFEGQHLILGELSFSRSQPQRRIFGSGSKEPHVQPDKAKLVLWFLFYETNLFYDKRVAQFGLWCPYMQCKTVLACSMTLYVLAGKRTKKSKKKVFLIFSFIWKYFRMKFIFLL